MRPVRHENNNMILKAESDDVVDLPITRHSGDHASSCWELSDEELALVNKTRQIWLTVATIDFHPPVCLTVKNPLEDS